MSQGEMAWVDEDRAFRPYGERCPYHYSRPLLYKYFNKWKHKNFYRMQCEHKDCPLSQGEWQTDQKICVTVWNMSCKLTKDA